MDIEKLINGAGMQGEIRKRAWARTKQRIKGNREIAFAVGIFLAVFGLFAGGPFGVLYFPGIALFILYAFEATRARGDFWKEFADEHGWRYEKKGVIADEKALVFKLGHSQRMVNVVSGEMRGLPLRIFEYVYVVGHGKHRKEYAFTVFEITVKGSFPHMYINNRHNRHSARPSGGATELPVPTEFEKSFVLYGPQKYEIEVLSLFTPDILESLLHTKWPHDVELVDSELLVFREGYVGGRAELDEEFEKASGIVTLLERNLMDSRLASVGDYTTYL